MGEVQYQPDVTSLGDLRAVGGGPAKGVRGHKKGRVLSEATQVEKTNASCFLMCRSWLLIRMDAYVAVKLESRA